MDMSWVVNDEGRGGSSGGGIDGLPRIRGFTKESCIGGRFGTDNSDNSMGRYDVTKANIEKLDFNGFDGKIQKSRETKK